MLIHLEKLGKSFGEKVVLHDVSASVEKEDRIGIVGQNGAGKTTLLKILTGVYTDYDGEFSVTHGVTLGYLEQNAKLDVTLDIYGEMRSSFAPVLDAMAQMQILEKKMAASPDDAALLEKHDELQNIIDAADGYNMDVNIKKVLSGMGFAQDTWSKNVGVLSGGELTRLRLAKLLLEKPDVLILDEPTNHLDFATMEWLENYLKGYSGAVLVVSHDRYFLDNVCTRIWEVSFQTMTTYKGNFSAYLPQKEAADALRQKQHDADVALAEKLQDYIDRNLVRASTTKMAQSRRKQLEKLEIVEAPTSEAWELNFRFEYDIEPYDELVIMTDSAILSNIDLTKVIAAHVKSGRNITVVTKAGICNGEKMIDLAMKLDGKGNVTDMLVDFAAPADYVASMDIFVVGKKWLIQQTKEMIARDKFHMDRDLVLGGWQRGKVSVNVYQFDGAALYNESVEEYFKNSMALIDRDIRHDMFGGNHPIYTKVRDRVPTYYGEECQIANCLAADGCMLEGNVKESILFRQVTIAPGADVENCVIMNDSVVGEGAELKYVILDKDVTVTPGAKLIGTKKSPVIVKRGETV